MCFRISDDPIVNKRRRAEWKKRTVAYKVVLMSGIREGQYTSPQRKAGAATYQHGKWTEAEPRYGKGIHLISKRNEDMAHEGIYVAHEGIYVLSSLRAARQYYNAEMAYYSTETACYKGARIIKVTVDSADLLQVAGECHEVTDAYSHMATYRRVYVTRDKPINPNLGRGIVKPLTEND